MESPQSVTKRRYEMEFLNSIGFLRDFIEENRKANHRGRLVLLFNNNDRIERMLSLCETAKLSETNVTDPRWEGPVSLLSRVRALLELLDNAGTVADSWVDELVRHESKAKKTVSKKVVEDDGKELPVEDCHLNERESGCRFCDRIMIISPHIYLQTMKATYTSPACSPDNEDDLYVGGKGANLCLDDVDSEDEQEYFAKRKLELTQKKNSQEGGDGGLVKRFMKPPPQNEGERPSSAEQRRKRSLFSFPALKETNLLDLTEVEESGVYTNNESPETGSATKTKQLDIKYVRNGLNPTSSSGGHFAQSFVPKGQESKVSEKDKLKLSKGANSQAVADRFEIKADADSLSASQQQQQAAAAGAGAETSGAQGEGNSFTGPAPPEAANLRQVAQPQQSQATSSSSSGGEPGAAEQKEQPEQAAPSTPKKQSTVVAEQPLLKPNDQIVIHGLRSEKAAIFNGREGIVIGYMAATKKYDALIEGKSRLRRRKNTTH